LLAYIVYSNCMMFCSFFDKVSCNSKSMAVGLAVHSPPF
jgi:hypothetical protein